MPTPAGKVMNLLKCSSAKRATTHCAKRERPQKFRPAVAISAGRLETLWEKLERIDHPFCGFHEIALTRLRCGERIPGDDEGQSPSYLNAPAFSFPAFGCI